MKKVYSYTIQTGSKKLQVELSGSELIFKTDGEIIKAKSVNSNIFGSDDLKVLAEKVANRNNGVIV